MSSIIDFFHDYQEMKSVMIINKMSCKSYIIFRFVNPNSDDLIAFVSDTEMLKLKWLHCRISRYYIVYVLLYDRFSFQMLEMNGSPVYSRHNIMINQNN